MPERKNPRKSPSKPRTLNRWDDDLDKGLMLCIQYACTEAGLKIPWARVAEIMGPTFTEGGIVQHLAKLRNLMMSAGIPVPPSVKRGMITKAPSRIYGSAANPRARLEPIPALFPDGTSGPAKIKMEEDAEQPTLIYERAKSAANKSKDDNGEDTADNTFLNESAIPDGPAKFASRAKAKTRGKGKGRRNNMSDDEEEEVPNLYDSDSEYGSPKKRRRSSARSKRKTPAAKAAVDDPLALSEATTLAAPIEDPQAEDAMIKVEEEDSGPAMRTRGVKRDYSQMAAPSSDEGEAELEQQEQTLQAVDDTLEYDGAAEAFAEDDNIASEAETDIVHAEDDGAVKAEFGGAFLEESHIVDTPYGQVYGNSQMVTDMSHQFQPGNVHDFNRVDYLNGGNQFSSQQFGYSNIASMNFMPPGNTFNSQFPSMSLYAASTDSSRNNSLGGAMGYSNLPSMSNANFLNTFSFNDGHSGDVINEEDHVNSMPGDDIFLTTQDSDFLIDPEV
ncbi:hypothetical protein A1O7_05164 [Cladophialophora yegresii CBS 114405]|uniref:Myb-like domain-containing protein n=1 Tax=Cladophialophora yegresii CBS 114405 TaxID=1182544 RepID=W9W901_9EURO|nr:uncharacterized protein A1O7_05164 [Cladophialophora yegresii CBS 114405]EXJ61011.1 hypothetical protein A1O7_05164 [Cladophialophora yegresii CBS 114405]